MNKQGAFAKRYVELSREPLTLLLPEEIDPKLVLSRQHLFERMRQDLTTLAYVSIYKRAFFDNQTSQFVLDILERLLHAPSLQGMAPVGFLIGAYMATFKFWIAAVNRNNVTLTKTCRKSSGWVHLWDHKLAEKFVADSSHLSPEDLLAELTSSSDCGYEHIADEMLRLHKDPQPSN